MIAQKNAERTAMRSHFRRKYQLSEVCEDNMEEQLGFRFMKALRPWIRDASGVDSTFNQQWLG